MKVTIQIKFRDPTLVPTQSFCFQESESLLVIKDVLEWFARSQKLDPDAVLSCFGLCRSLKARDFLLLDQPILSLVKKSIWKQNFNIVLYISFWRLPIKWDIHVGLRDEKANHMLFIELKERYLHQKLKHSKNSNLWNLKELDKQTRIVASLSALLRLADSWVLNSEEQELDSNITRNAVKQYIPHDYYSLLTEQQWKKYIEEREKSWNDSERRQNVDLCPNPPQWIIVQWITVLMTIMPFSFWAITFRVKYLQLTGMTPEKECMIRSTRYKLDLSISVDGLCIEWPEKEARKEGKSMAKSNDSERRNVLEGFHGNTENIYFPFGWIQSIKLLTMPAIISNSDASSSQVFINDDDLFGSTSSIMQLGNTQTSNAGFSPTFPNSQGILSNNMSNGLKSSIHSAISAPSLTPAFFGPNNASSVIVYMRLAAGIRGVRKSISSLILLKMSSDEFCLFQTQYEYQKELKHVFLVRDYFKEMIKHYPRQFLDQMLMDCGWQISAFDYEAFDNGASSPILPIRLFCKMLNYDEKSNQDCQIWAMNPHSSCDGLLIAICEQNKLTKERLLFGLQCNNRWLDMKLSLLGQGCHFLRDTVTFRMKWLVPIQEKIIEAEQMNPYFIDASFFHLLHAITNAALPLDRQVFIDLCVSCLRMLIEQHPISTDTGFPSLVELGQFMKNQCPLWEWLKRVKCSPEQEQLALKEIYRIYLIQASKTDIMLDRIRLINLFEKKLSFIYFSWQPNYHRIGVSPFGWILQKRGEIIRQTRYSSASKSGMPTWKCICNGLHLQFSEVKNISERVKRQGKLETRLLLNDSYSTFALHSLQIALLIEESFQLSRHAINRSNDHIASISNINNSNMGRRLSMNEPAKNDIIGRVSQCSLLMTSLSSPYCDIPKLSPSPSISELQASALSYPLKSQSNATVTKSSIHGHEISIEADADNNNTVPEHHVFDEAHYDDQNARNDHILDASETNTDMNECQHDSSQHRNGGISSLTMSFRSILGLSLGKRDTKVQDMSILPEKSQMKNGSMISLESCSQIAILASQTDDVHHYNTVTDIGFSPTAYSSTPSHMCPDAMINDTFVSTISIHNNIHDPLLNNVLQCDETSQHINPQIDTKNETKEYQALDFQTFTATLPILSGSAIEPSPDKICVPGGVKRIVNIFESEFLSSSLTDSE